MGCIGTICTLAALNSGPSIRHLTAEELRALQPDLDLYRAVELSSLLNEYSPDPVLSAAILMQESGLRDVHPSSTQDIGIAQIHEPTAKHYKCNLARLRKHVLSEAIQCHSRILRDKQALCRPALGKMSFLCYHSIHREKQRVYLRQITPYLRALHWSE